MDRGGTRGGALRGSGNEGGRREVALTTTQAGILVPVWRPDHVLVRAARTGVLGLTAAVLAAVAHACGGGTPPSPGAVLGVALIAALACWRASRRRMGAVRCAVVSAAVQSALHLTVVAGAPTSPGHGGLGMLAGHVVAGAAFGVWLAVGEAALWRAARRLTAATAAAVRNVAALASLLLADGGSSDPLPGTQLAADRSLRPVPQPVLRHAVVRRGPPALTPAA